MVERVEVIVEDHDPPEAVRLRCLDRPGAATQPSATSGLRIPGAVRAASPLIALSPVALEPGVELIRRCRLGVGRHQLRARASRRSPASIAAMNASWSWLRARSAQASSRARARRAAVDVARSRRNGSSRAAAAPSARISSIDSCHASTSISGGGVGGMVSVRGGDPDAADVADESGAFMQVGDVMRRVAGRVGDLEARHRAATRRREDTQVRLGHGDATKSPHSRSMSSPYRRPRALQQARGIDQVRRAALVDVDLELRPALARASRSRRRGRDGCG